MSIDTTGKLSYSAGPQVCYKKTPTITKFTTVKLQQQSEVCRHALFSVNFKIKIGKLTLKV